MTIGSFRNQTFLSERKVPLITTPLPPFGKGDWGRGVVSKEIRGKK
jgi:hypothetical protein